MEPWSENTAKMKTYAKSVCITQLGTKCNLFSTKKKGNWNDKGAKSSHFIESKLRFGTVERLLRASQPIASTSPKSSFGTANS